MAVNIRVNVHPVVLFQIADAYERRPMENNRVIGTLVGRFGSWVDECLGSFLLTSVTLVTSGVLFFRFC